MRGLLDSCEWYEVYDVIEAIHRRLCVNGQPDHFARELDTYFCRRGIGWQLIGGFIQTRGPESFERTVTRAHAVLTERGRPTSAREIHEALRDPSRRPEPDITGSIQHSLAALECLARDITGDSGFTLGAIIKRHPSLLPPPLDAAVEKLWGFASEQGRHLREGRAPGHAEAELTVEVSAAVAVSLAAKHRA